MEREIKIINGPEYMRKLQNRYDEICGAAYVNIFSESKNSNVIAISPFNPHNKEHLFVLNVAKGVSGVVGKNVAVDTNWFQLWKLNRGLSKECRYIKFHKQDGAAIDPDKLTNFMRKWASELCEVEEFDFGKIYNTFYRKKGNK